MYPFDPESRYTHPLGYQLVQASPIALVKSDYLLSTVTAQLLELEYQILRFNAEEWPQDSDLFTAFERRLGFPAGSIRNFGALEDYIWDFAAGEYEMNSTSVGTFFLLDRFDTYFNVHEESALIVLNLLARQSRTALLHGHLMSCLVRTDRHDSTFPPMGATRATSAFGWPPDFPINPSV